MTEEDAENDFKNRERAVWPDEPSPFEEPFRDEIGYAAEAQERFIEPPPSEIQFEDDILEIREEAEPKVVLELPPASAAGEPTNEVWLNGPPPDEFPFFQTPAPSPPAADSWPDQLRPFEPPFVPVVYTPESTAENVRRSGLAWSAGIVFVFAVAFMLFLGWLADLLLGSTPWGIVVGVVLGSIIGFIQLFRISSQIFAPKSDDHRPFLSRDDDKD